MYFSSQNMLSLEHEGNVFPPLYGKDRPFEQFINICCAFQVGVNWLKGSWRVESGANISGSEFVCPMNFFSLVIRHLLCSATYFKIFFKKNASLYGSSTCENKCFVLFQNKKRNNSYIRMVFSKWNITKPRKKKWNIPEKE